MQDVRRGGADATAQLAHTAHVAPTAERSDVETVGPDPVLVTELRLVHRGDGDIVTPLAQDGQQRRGRALGAARAEAVDDEEHLHGRSTELPCDLPGDTVDDGHLGLPSEQRRGERDITARAGDIAGLR